VRRLRDRPHSRAVANSRIETVVSMGGFFENS
jgi:hypothetical protein